MPSKGTSPGVSARSHDSHHGNDNLDHPHRVTDNDMTGHNNTEPHSHNPVNADSRVHFSDSKQSLATLNEQPYRPQRHLSSQIRSSTRANYLGVEYSEKFANDSKLILRGSNLYILFF